MNKIITLEEITQLSSSLKKNKKSIVLVGGCFDIVHIGHIEFLMKAKKFGNILCVLLEHDKKVRLLKGGNRPFNNQKERAQFLSAISFIDYIIPLPFLKSDSDYDQLIFSLKPDVIAVTTDDPFLEKKKGQANHIGGKIKKIPLIKTRSTSKIANLLGID